MKKREIEKVFGKEENKSYRVKRNTFFILLVVLFLIFFFFRRYFNFLTNIQYLELVNLISLVGLAIVIFSFYLADKSFNLNFKKRHYFYVYFTSIAGITMSFLYFTFPYYDKVQHFFFPMMYASIIYFTISKKLNLNLFWKLSFTFFIIIGSLSMFELLEYFLDFLFDWKLQGVFLENTLFPGGYETILNRIDDTMIDIALGILGTLTYILSVLFIEKNKRKD